MMVTIVDGRDLILGRLCASIAKRALQGEEIAIVNAEKIVVSGNKEDIFEKKLEMLHRGQQNYGPFYPKTPERMVKRVIRGMLPYKKSKGREALKRVKCYIGLPEGFKNEKLERIDAAESKRLQYKKVVTMEAISRKMGARQ